MADTPPKAALDARTDQALAWFRDARPVMEADGVASAVFLGTAGAMAEQVRAQFPGMAAGRLMMAVAQSGKAALAVVPALGADGVLSVIALAAEQLDREGGA